MNSSIYNTILMQHHRSPIGWSDRISLPLYAQEVNVYCGDDLIVALSFDGKSVLDIQFSGECCAICRASASMMCEQLQSQSLLTIQQEMFTVIEALEQQKDLPEAYQAFEAINDYPSRAQCALLPWRALETILSSTEFCRKAEQASRKKTLAE